MFLPPKIKMICTPKVRHFWGAYQKRDIKLNEEKPLLEKDGGYGMLFVTFDNKTVLSIHI